MIVLGGESSEGVGRGFCLSRRSRYMGGEKIMKSVLEVRLVETTSHRFDCLLERKRET